jgi:hypothetical protein
VQEAAEEDSADGVGLANVQFFRPDTFGYVTSWVVSMMTGGIMLLFFRWMPIMHLRYANARKRTHASHTHLPRESVCC